LERCAHGAHNRVGIDAFTPRAADESAHHQLLHRLVAREGIRIALSEPLELPGAAFRLDGLIVGRYEVASRLGFDRRGVKGPWLVAAVVRRLARSSRFVAWEHVDDTEHVIRLQCRADELDPPAPLPLLRTGSVA